MTQLNSKTCLTIPTDQSRLDPSTPCNLHRKPPKTPWFLRIQEALNLRGLARVVDLDFLCDKPNGKTKEAANAPPKTLWYLRLAESLNPTKAHFARAFPFSLLVVSLLLAANLTKGLATGPRLGWCPYYKEKVEYSVQKVYTIPIIGDVAEYRND